MPKKKITNKERIKALENEVLTLRAFVHDFSEFVGYESQELPKVKPIEIEPYSIFRKKLRETEKKYALKVS